MDLAEGDPMTRGGDHSTAVPHRAGGTYLRPRDTPGPLHNYSYDAPQTRCSSL